MDNKVLKSWIWQETYTLAMWNEEFAENLLRKSKLITLKLFKLSLKIFWFVLIELISGQ